MESGILCLKIYIAQAIACCLRTARDTSIQPSPFIIIATTTMLHKYKQKIAVFHVLEVHYMYSPLLGQLPCTETVTIIDSNITIMARLSVRDNSSIIISVIFFLGRI